MWVRRRGYGSGRGERGGLLRVVAGEEVEEVGWREDGRGGGHANDFN
jgi:hypothetical protein